MELKKDKLLAFSIGFFLIYIFFGYILQKTTFELQSFVYGVIVILFVGFGILFLKYFKGKVTTEVLLWMPYMLYTMYEYITQGNWEFFVYWFACFVILMISRYCGIEKYISMKLLFFIGLFFVVGVYVQYFFPKFHSKNIAILFKTSGQIEYWGKEYGLAGFAYQLDAAAVPIIIGTFVCLFSKGKETINKIIFVILAIAVFMTGKRMGSLIVVAVPMLVYFFSQKKLTGKLKALFIIAIVIIAVYYIIYYNLDYFYNTKAFHRIVKSVYDVENQVDITSGRNDLYALAFKTFKNNWFTGVGVGNFMKYTRAYTDVHNTYLQVLCEQGVIGITLFVIPLVVSLMSVIDMLHHNNIEYCEKYLLFSLSIQLMYVLLSFSGNTNINMWGYCLYFMAVGITESCIQIKKQESLGEIS